MAPVIWHFRITDLCMCFTVILPADLAVGTTLRQIKAAEFKADDLLNPDWCGFDRTTRSNGLEASTSRKNSLVGCATAYYIVKHQGIFTVSICASQS